MKRTTEEMENAPRPRGESMKIDLKDKLPELPEGYNLDGTPKVHSPAPAPARNGKGREAGDWTPSSVRTESGPYIFPNQGKVSGEGIATPPEAAHNDKKPEARAEKQAAPDEKAEGAEVIPFKGLVPLGTLKAEAEEGTERRMERTVWCKGKWVQMEIRDGKCQFAFVKEPMMQGELILDALNAIAEISEEICEAANELAAEEKRMLKGRE